MRILLAITVFIFSMCPTRAVEPGDVDASKPDPWQEPFATISASKADQSLVLLLITNEDPFAARQSLKPAKKNPPAIDIIPPAWCAQVLARSYREAIETRRDLDGRMTLQSISAGLPFVLTGGESRNVPARAILALCDGNYRLLSLMVGVPDVDDLLTLIEDGEDVAVIRQLDATQPNSLTGKIVDRSRERLSRLWRGVLAETAVAMQEDVGQNSDTAETQQSLDARLRLLSETFEPTYFADVRLRFGLTDASDRTRLAVLEQHVEARRPWCEAVIPFVAGIDFSQSWRLFVESIWGHPAVTADDDAGELLAWFDLQIKTDAMVLSLTPPMRLQRLPWPPIDDQGAKRGVGWQEVHKLALEHPFRVVGTAELALLLKSRDLNPVDIQQPSRARYLWIEPKKKSPLVVREGDSPGRFAGILKRSKSSLINR